VDVDSAFGVSWAGAGDNPDPSADNNKTQPDFDPTTEATTLINRALINPGDLIQWNLTSLVNRWRDGEVPNLGVLLRDPSTDGDFRELRIDAKDGAFLSVPDPKWHVGPRLLLVFQAEPASMADCRGGLWSRFSTLKFKNQGDCVSYVATAGRKPPSGR
jgi:hypothetical protein